MTEESKFIDNTIIRLRREYSKDELVAALNKQLTEKDIEIGKLTSEVEHLNEQLKQTEEKKIVDREARIRARKEELYTELRNRIKEQQEKIKSMKITLDNLLSTQSITSNLSSGERGK